MSSTEEFVPIFPSITCSCHTSFPVRQERSILKRYNLHEKRDHKGIQPKVNWVTKRSCKYGTTKDMDIDNKVPKIVNEKRVGKCAKKS